MNTIVRAGVTPHSTKSRASSNVNALPEALSSAPGMISPTRGSRPRWSMCEPMTTVSDESVGSDPGITPTRFAVSAVRISAPTETVAVTPVARLSGARAAIDVRRPRRQVGQV